MLTFLQALQAQGQGLPRTVVLLVSLGGLGALGGLAAALATLYLARQNRHLLRAQAGKAEADTGASMISSAIALTKALREEEEACRKRLAELSERQDIGIKERQEMIEKISELERDMVWLRKKLDKDGATLK